MDRLKNLSHVWKCMVFYPARYRSRLWQGAPGPSADLRFLATSTANQHVLDVKFQLQGIYLGITNKKFLLGRLKPAKKKHFFFFSMYMHGLYVRTCTLSKSPTAWIGEYFQVHVHVRCRNPLRHKHVLVQYLYALEIPYFVDTYFYQSRTVPVRGRNPLQRRSQTQDCTKKVHRCPQL